LEKREKEGPREGKRKKNGVHASNDRAQKVMQKSKNKAEKHEREHRRKERKMGKIK